MAKELFNAEYEKIILGMMLLDNSIIDVIKGRLTSDCFYTSEARFVFLKIVEQWDKDKCVNILSLHSVISNFDPSWIVSLTDIGSTANWEFYVNKIKQFYLTRTFKTELGQTLNKLNPDSVNDSISGLQSKLATFMQFGNSGVDVKNLCLEVPLEIESASKSNKKYIGYETGFEELDDILDGFQNGSMYVIGARTSIGKTAFVLTLLRKLCQHGASPCIFSLEMSAKSCFYRMLSSETNLPMWQLKKGTCFKYQSGISKLKSGLAKLYDYNINIIDCAQSDESLVSQIRYEATVKGKDVFVVDHLGLVQISKPSAQHYLDVGQITAKLHALSKELNIVIILLCQMNREAEGKKPNISLIRESGNIEQDADVIMFLYRERDLEEDNVPTQVIIEKNRDGKIGYANFIFNKPTQDFKVDNGFRNKEVGEVPKVPVSEKKEAEYEELPF